MFRSACLLLTVLLTAACGSGEGEVVSAFWKYRTALSSGDAAAVREALAREPAAELDGENAEALLELAGSMAPGAPTVGAVTVAGNQATLELTADLQGETMTGTVTFVREDGAWKVQHEDWSLEMGGGFTGPEWIALFGETGGRVPFAPRSVRHGHEGTVTRAAFLPDGDRFVTASWDDKRLCLWDGTGEGPLDVVECDRRPHDLVVMPDGSAVTVVDAYGNVTVWPVGWSEFGPPWTLMGDAGTVPRVAVSADGKLLATTGHGYPVAVWDVALGKKVEELSDSESMRGVAFSPAGPVVVCGTPRNELVLWDLDARILGRKSLKIPKVTESSDVWAVAWDPRGKYLATGHMDASVTVWDAERRKPLHDSYIQDASTYDVEFSPDGTVLASAHQNGRIHFWDPESGRQIGRVDAHQGAATTVAFRPDGRPALVTGGEDGNVVLWE